MRKAVLVGCLYRNTPYELRGCINDVSYWNRLLINRFNFEPDSIQVLTDQMARTPTRDNIMTALNHMIDNAGPQDALFFFFSGHGTWIQESSMIKQAIVPLDAVENKDATLLITSNDIRMLVNNLKSGATLTILSDSGHSGRLINGELPQNKTLSPEIVSPKPKGPKMSKSIPPGWFNPPPTIPSQPMGATGTESDDGILLSACQPDAIAYEIVPDDNPAYGAFTGAIRAHFHEYAEPISNWELVKHAREKLIEWQVYQHPCLYCSNNNADAPFLLQTLKKLE